MLSVLCRVSNVADNQSAFLARTLQPISNQGHNIEMTSVSLHVECRASESECQSSGGLSPNDKLCQNEKDMLINVIHVKGDSNIQRV